MNELPAMVIPEVNCFEHIIARAEKQFAMGKKCRAALLIPADTDMYLAFKKAIESGFIEPMIIGDEKAIKNAGGDIERLPGNIPQITTRGFKETISQVAKKVRAGEIDLIINGRIPVADMLGILFKPESDFKVKDRLISHVAVIKPEQYKKLLLLTDGAVVVNADLKVKLGLIHNIIEVANRIGIFNPRIAILAAVEVIYPQMPVTMEAAILAKMAERQQIKGAFIDGPLSFDIAVDMFAAHSKGVRNSEVAGQADALLAPNIEVANGIYKAMALYGHCPMGGIIFGGRVPIALNARSDSQENKFHSIVLGLLTS